MINTWNGRDSLTDWPEMDYAVMTPENGWDLIYQPPASLMPAQWIRRWMRDEHADQNHGIEVEFYYPIGDIRTSRLLRRFRIGPRRLSEAINRLLENGPEPLNTLALPQSLATALRDVFYFKYPVKVGAYFGSTRRNFRWEIKPLRQWRLLDAPFLEFSIAYGVKLHLVGLDARLQLRNLTVNRKRTGRPMVETRGEGSPVSKLTDDLVREIRWRHRRGHTFNRMAREYGVTRTTISYICHRMTWKHVTDEPPEWYTTKDYEARARKLQEFHCGVGQ